MSEAPPLASRSEAPELERVDETGTREFLAFRLGQERYALPLSTVREILRIPHVTEVPRCPEEVIGVTSVRGTVTTVLDLRVRLRMPCERVTARARILLVDCWGEPIGMLVDEILQVYRLREDEVELTSALGSEGSGYVMGIGRPGSSSRRRDASGGARVQEVLILLDGIALMKEYRS
ncbi:MAG: chemotaxis protein CheW [Myxococcales bacterium]|nr:chemotaxis protein CheW [Myxococcales bacterium]